MNQWFALGFLCLFLTGCSKNSTKPGATSETGRPNNLLFLNDLHAQFPKHFSLPILKKFVESGKIIEASAYINKALEISPKCAALHIAQGFIWEIKAMSGESNASKMASVAYQTAATVDPGCAIAHYLLGVQNFKQGDPITAQEHLAKAVLIRPNHGQFNYMLASASYLCQDIRTAYCAIKKAISCKPNDPLYQRTAAIIFAAAGKAPEAKSMLDCYKKSTGSQYAKDFDYVKNRIQYWNAIYANPKSCIAVRSAPEADMNSSKTLPSDQSLPSIILDCYILLVNQGDISQKGNNVMNAFDQNAYSTGTPALNDLSLVLGGSSPGPSTFDSNKKPTIKPLLWWGRQREIASDSKGTKDLNSSGHIFNYQVTPLALNYALNIANASHTVVTYSSRPTISTLLGKTAEFTSGNSYKTAPSGGSLITIDAGDVVTVVPASIAEDGLITFNITIQSASPAGLGGTAATLGAALTNQLVQVNRSSISTTVKAYPGQTLMLGGLKTTQKFTNDSRFPLLGSIPILQYFFSSVNKRETEVSIIYLLTARLGGDGKKFYESKRDPNRIFNQLQEADPIHFSMSAPPTVALIFKHLSSRPLFSDFQSGDVTELQDSSAWSLKDRWNQLISFLYF